jgi:hypothetical protein
MRDTSPAEAVAAVLDMERGDFFKSMTAHARHDVWQDVYLWPQVWAWRP